MRNIFYYDTKIGKLEIEENGEAITKIDFAKKEIEEDFEKKETLLLNNNEIFCAGCHGVSFKIKRRKNYETDIITTKT